MKSGRIYHLISRFVAKEWFLESDRERNCYRSLLGAALEGTDWRLFTYAIMSSHLHLGLVAGTVPLVEWMRPMHTHFASWMNVQRERIGGIFVRGPNVREVHPNGVAPLIDYIHRNPERAGLVGHANDSDWTSQRAYVGLSPQPRWLDVECGLGLVGMTRVEFQVWLDVARKERTTVEPKRGPGRPRNEPSVIGP